MSMASPLLPLQLRGENWVFLYATLYPTFSTKCSGGPEKDSSAQLPVLAPRRSS